MGRNRFTSSTPHHSDEQSSIDFSGALHCVHTPTIGVSWHTLATPTGNYTAPLCLRPPACVLLGVTMSVTRRCAAVCRRVFVQSSEVCRRRQCGVVSDVSSAPLFAVTAPNPPHHMLPRDSRRIIMQPC